MLMRLVKTILIAGDNASVLEALGHLVRSVLPEGDRGAVAILTADSEEEILRTLGREKVDVFVVNHEQFEVGYELIRWLNQGPFKMKKVLIAGSDALSKIDSQADGIDVVLTRPVSRADLARAVEQVLSTR